MMELEIAQSEHHRESAAKVFEGAGGYAPTIGIIGAVLGLIQVMKHLENIEEVGKGIAVAFVATVYGVAVSNLIFLPAANKLKARIRQDAQDKELLLEGVCSIVEGMNPKQVPALPGEQWRFPTENDLFINADLGGPAADATRPADPSTAASPATTKPGPAKYRGPYGFTPVSE